MAKVYVERYAPVAVTPIKKVTLELTPGEAQLLHTLTSNVRSNGLYAHEISTALRELNLPQVYRVSKTTQLTEVELVG
jgi:hypothetical protein